MTKSGNQIIGRGSYGKSLFLSDEERIEFTFNAFESLGKEQYLTSAAACHGHQWQLAIFPFGFTDAAKAQEQVSVFLLFKDLADEVSYKINCKFYLSGTLRFSGSSTFNSAGYCMGHSMFMKRDDIIEELNQDGSLTIEVGIQGWFDTAPIWKPKNTIQQKLIDLYNCDREMDVTFVLGNGNMVRAHRSVLFIQCQVLYEIVLEAGAGAAIEIENVDADLFATLIRFMYFESLPSTFDLEQSGVEMLKLANKFGYSALKMYIEADLVGSNLLTVETAASYLLLADSNSFALLKEAALDFVCARSVEVMETEGWNEVKESSKLLAEILSQIKGRKSVDEDRVSALRKRLADAGEDVDGTKEMLVKRCRTTLEAKSGGITFWRRRG